MHQVANKVTQVLAPSTLVATQSSRSPRGRVVVADSFSSAARYLAASRWKPNKYAVTYMKSCFSRRRTIRTRLHFSSPGSVPFRVDAEPTSSPTACFEAIRRKGWHQSWFREVGVQLVEACAVPYYQATSHFAYLSMSLACTVYHLLLPNSPRNTTEHNSICLLVTLSQRNSRNSASTIVLSVAF